MKKICGPIARKLYPIPKRSNEAILFVKRWCAQLLKPAIGYASHHSIHVHISFNPSSIRACNWVGLERNVTLHVKPSNWWFPIIDSRGRNRLNHPIIWSCWPGKQVISPCWSYCWFHVAPHLCLYWDLTLHFGLSTAPCSSSRVTHVHVFNFQPPMFAIAHLLAGPFHLQCVNGHDSNPAPAGQGFEDVLCVCEVCVSFCELTAVAMCVCVSFWIAFNDLHVCAFVVSFQFLLFY